MVPVDPHTPVLVGIGIVEQREQDPGRAKEAISLMSDALRASAADSGCPQLAAQAEVLSVPQGLWSYSDPGRLLARQVGADTARTVLAEIGVMQQALIDDVCRGIAGGEISVAAVVGGEARYRALRAQIAGLEALESPCGSEPDVYLAPDRELYLDAELEALGHMPVGYYAVIESAYRAAQGWTLGEHRNRLASLYSRFSEVAADNPHAWKPARVAPELIRNPSPKNPMLAFPYTKLHNSSWNVDQASAMLFCSAARAAEMGIPRERWVFPIASAESNHMLSLTQRPCLHRLPGARLTGEAVLREAGLTLEDCDFLEIYSCFPIAVELYAAELGLAEDAELTVTGGMPFAGGPLNNFVLQSSCRLVELLRSKPGSSGLVSSVSGMLTKQAYALWSMRPPEKGFRVVDVSEAVKREYPACEVIEDYAGEAEIIGYTVLYEGGQRDRAVALLRLPGDAQSIAVSDDPVLMESMEVDEHCGRPVEVAHGQFVLI